MFFCLFAFFVNDFSAYSIIISYYFLIFLTIIISYLLLFLDLFKPNFACGRTLVPDVSSPLLGIGGPRRAEKGANEIFVTMGVVSNGGP